MNQAQLIKKINKLYPTVKAAPYQEFTSNKNDVGIWFRGSESALIDNDLPLYDYWNTSWAETFGVNPDFEQFMYENGWYCENYDAGTLLAFPY